MIVIDTHVLVWWASGSLAKLSTAARKQLEKSEKSDGGILVSAISAWEITVLVNKGRLILSMEADDWLGHAERLPGVRFLAIDRHTAVQSVCLPQPFHNDPADRIIVATARGLNLPLVTADKRISTYHHVKTIW